MSGLPEAAKRTAWLRDWSYPHIYGNLALAASGSIPVVMPFLSRSLSLSLLTHRRNPLWARESWRPSLRGILSDRKLYSHIIRSLAPELLQVTTDRGYPPRFDGTFLAPVLTASAALASHRRRRRREAVTDRDMRRLVADRLSDLLPSPVADAEKVRDALDRWETWTGEQYFELSKLLSVILMQTESEDAR